MAKIWRCPECETLNQTDKCIVCGHKYTADKTEIDNAANHQSHIVIDIPSNNVTPKNISKVSRNSNNYVDKHDESLYEIRRNFERMRDSGVYTQEEINKIMARIEKMLG